MSKKVTVNEAKVLELWSKGYNNAQVKATLGITKGTWDRWYKGYRERPTEETSVTSEETSVPQCCPSTSSNVGRGGVRYRYTDPVKYEEFRKQEAMRIMEQNAKQEITHKAPERFVKPKIPEEM